MLDFREEIEKFKPAVELEGVNLEIGEDEIKDVMDILERFTQEKKEV